MQAQLADQSLPNFLTKAVFHELVNFNFSYDVMK